MAVTVTPEALVPGDIIRVENGVYRVESIIADEDGGYPAIIALRCRTGDKQHLVLGPSAMLTRLEPIRRRDIENELSELHPGDTLAITYWDMGFWA